MRLRPLRFDRPSAAQSLTEFPAYWCERPEMFAAIADGKTPEERATLVLQWFIVRPPSTCPRRPSTIFAIIDLRHLLVIPQCTLKGQYMSRNEKLGSEKKSVLAAALDILPQVALADGPLTHP